MGRGDAAPADAARRRRGRRRRGLGRRPRRRRGPRRRPVDAAPADAGDAGGVDAGPLPDLDTCAEPAPVRLFERAFLPEPGGLAVIGLDDAEVGRRAWPEGATPTGLAAWPGRPLGSAQVFATLRTAAGCRIEGLDEAARLRWFADVPACQPATVGGARVLVAAGGQVFALDPDDGGARAVVALPAVATTPVAYGGLDENGGSHWYVGVTDAVVELVPAGADLALGGRAPVDLRPTHLAVGDATTAVVLGSPPGVVGLPERAQPLALEPAPRVAGVAFRLPGAVHTAPLVLPRCDGLDANGGSHWWCGGGALVVGGDGWLGAWRLGDGTPIFVEDQGDVALRVSGLAAGRDGRIYNGGSHWRDGGWRVRASDPAGSEALVAGPSGPRACVASPLLDGSGRLWASLSEGGVIRAQTSAGGLAAGWARQGGDAAGSGAAVTPVAVCPGGDAALFARRLDPVDTLTPAVAGALGADLLVAGQREGDRGSELWAARLHADGAVRWSRGFPDAMLDPGLPPPLAVGPLADDRVLVIQPTPDFMRLLRLTPDGDILADLRVGSRVPHVALAATTVPQGGGAVVGSFPGVADGQPDHWLFPIGDDGAQGAEVALTDPLGPFAPTHVAAWAAGYVIAGRARDGLVVRGLSAAGAERWRVPLAGQASVAGLAVDAAGTTFVLTTVLGPDALALTLIDAGGAPSTGDGLADVLPAALALDPAGGGAVLTKDMDLYPLSAAGALDPPTHLADQTRGLGLAAVPGGVFALGQPDAEGAPGATLIRADREGRTSCAAAGRCVGVACPGEAPCARATCAPATGACGVAPRDDGQACGPGLVCQAGACAAR
ncbi:MAG: hypothetical protein H6706_15610 [Myxococcales bacterium]|nr:hypothetical protein [Myxococcales bacterium]